MTACYATSETFDTQRRFDKIETKNFDNAIADGGAVNEKK